MIVLWLIAKGLLQKRWYANQYSGHRRHPKPLWDGHGHQPKPDPYRDQWY